MSDLHHAPPSNGPGQVSRSTVQLQLCRPGQGESPQRRVLDRHGEGVFHLGFDVADCDEDESQGRALGLSSLIRGRRADRSGFTVFDTAAQAGVGLEIRSDAPGRAGTRRRATVEEDVMIRSIDLNSDLGESYGAWRMGDDEAMLGVVTSANIACGAHAGDPQTMFETLRLAHRHGVVAGAHPGFADREGFGRRLIPSSATEIERFVATQIGALMGSAALLGSRVRYVKPHGALANYAADDRAVSDAIVRAIAAISKDLAVLAISGTELEAAARGQGLAVYSEIFADRGYLNTGRLVPRSRPDAMIHDPHVAADRLVGFLQTGAMPTVDGPPIRLEAHSICVHGDGAGAVAMARAVRDRLTSEGFGLAPFLAG